MITTALALALGAAMAAGPAATDPAPPRRCASHALLGTWRVVTDIPFTKDIYHDHFTLTLARTSRPDCAVLMRLELVGRTVNGVPDDQTAKLRMGGSTTVAGLAFDPAKGAAAEVRLVLTDRASKGKVRRHLLMRLVFDAKKRLTGVWANDRSSWTSQAGMPDGEFHGNFKAARGAGKPVVFRKLPEIGCALACDGQYGWGQADPDGDVNWTPSNAHDSCLDRCRKRP
jgi:hypothetical protein